MTSRFAVQTYLSQNGDWYSNVLLNITENGGLEFINHLHALSTETARTKYVEGVVSPSPFSLKEHFNIQEYSKFPDAYAYLYFGDDSEVMSPGEITKPLLIDFGTSDPSIINKIIVRHIDKLMQIPMREFIYAACIRPAIYYKTFFPSIPLAQSHAHWEDVDVMNNRFTADTRIGLFAHD